MMNENVRTYVVHLRQLWFCFARIDKKPGVIYPVEHQHFYAPACEAGVVAVSYAYTTRASATRHAKRYGRYCGVVKQVESLVIE